MFRSRFLAALAVAGGSALLAAAPAAQAVVNSTPSASLAPAQNGDTLTFSATWTPPADNLSFVSYINVTASGTRPDGKAVPNVPGMQQCGPWGSPSTPQNGPPQTCAASFTATYNGTYSAVSNAHGCDYLDPCNPLDTTAPSWGTVTWPTITINNPPVVPQNLNPRPFDDATRTVKIQWDRNPEPDLVDYVVGRSIDGGNSTFFRVNPMSNPYYKDTDTPNGGSYAYSVMAERAATNGNPCGPDLKATCVRSDVTTPVVVNVPAPPPPPTTTVAGGGTPGSSVPGGGTGGGTSGTKPLNGSGGPKPGANYSPNKLDINAFTAALNAAKAKHGGPNNSGSISEAPAAPDPGYSGSLPYKTPANTPEDGASTANAPPLAKAATAKNNVRTTAAVAGGLLAIVLAMHGMWLRAEVKRAALLEPVEPEPFGPTPLLELG